MKIVMVEPSHYDLRYVLPDNHWMVLNFKKNPPDKLKASQQWEKIRNIYRQLGIEVEIMASQKMLPDMVFVANAGLPFGSRFILSQFRHHQRRPEQQFYKFFFGREYRLISWDHADMYFEGQGDALWAEDKLLVGYGFRTSKSAVGILGEVIDRVNDIITLGLRTDIMPTNFYHLDTALSYLGNNNYLVYQSAFTRKAFRQIENLGNLILVDEIDARQLVCNAVTIGKKVILQKPSPRLKEKLENLGYEIIGVDTSEFIKSGGSVKCLTLIID